MSDSIAELASEIRRLVDQVNAPKRKDWSERLSVLSAFLSTVVIAVAGLYFSQAAQRAETNRQREFQQAQIALQRAQVRIEELKALTSVAPLLASHDSTERAVAAAILDAVKASDEAQGTAIRPDPSARRRTSAMELSLLDTFLRQAQDARAGDARRIAALRQAEEVAISSGVPGDRIRAVGVARAIAGTPGTSEQVRRAASEVAVGIGGAQPSEASSGPSPLSTPPLAVPLDSLPATSQSSAPNGENEGARVVRLINEHRARVGCPPLALDQAAARAAQVQTETMMHLNAFTHLTSDGGDVGTRLEAAGARWRVVGENIASGQQTPEIVVSDWLNRAGHRANIENCIYRRAGVSHDGVLWALVLYAPL